MGEKMTTMSIADKTWTIDGLIEHWISQDWGHTMATAAASTQRVWIAAEVRKVLPGWAYDSISGQFHGPAHDRAFAIVTALVNESRSRLAEPELA